jgi:hypothetical protein
MTQITPINGIICNRKHTKYQPTDEQWRCPNCGAGNESFYIDNDDSASDCGLLHVDDTIVCDCGQIWSGKQLAQIMRRIYKNGVKRCPHCNGTGWTKC